MTTGIKFVFLREKGDVGSKTTYFLKAKIEKGSVHRIIQPKGTKGSLKCDLRDGFY